ncbi:MAG: hypothetical protein PHD82_07185, partial [Candidatus Riflebacteria bacterium]|nr:hypothetical protein [Candidatus Riflebacteria bacterium]
MAETTQETKTLKDRLPDILGMLGSVAIILVAILIFTNRIPRNFQAYFSYFYLFAAAGILGLVGEKIAVTLLSFILPLLLGAATIALKFKPEKYPIEEWWEIYSIIVLFAAGFLIYLFFRFEQIKAMGGSGQGQVGAD